MLGTPPASLSTLPLRPAPELEWTPGPVPTSPWLWAAFILLAIGFAIIIALRRRRPAADPRTVWRRDLDAVFALADGPEKLLAAEALIRRQLALRWGPLAFSSTTRELSERLTEISSGPGLEAAREVLAAADRLKFAGEPPPPSTIGRLIAGLSAFSDPANS